MMGLLETAMFNKILVALDGSDHATKALQTAVELAIRCDATLVLCHAVQTPQLRADYDKVVAKKAQKIYRQIGKERADDILGAAEKVARKAGLSEVERLVQDGDPVKALLKAIDKASADLLVIGTRGMTGLREIAMGGVAHKVTVAAPCPVLVVK